MNRRPVDRRSALKMTAGVLGAAALPRALHGQPAVRNATFTFDNKSLCTVPLDFTGLSYESPQLANPSFFSPDNKELISLDR